jgi:hypothetical protein
MRKNNKLKERFGLQFISYLSERIYQLASLLELDGKEPEQLWEVIKRTVFSDEFLSIKNNPVEGNSIDTLILAAFQSLRTLSHSSLNKVLDEYNKKHRPLVNISSRNLEKFLQQIRFEKDSLTRKSSDLLSSSNGNIFNSINGSDSNRIIEKIVGSPFSMTLNLR